MKKLATIFLGLAAVALCQGEAMATSDYLSDVNNSCGYEVITDCTYCHYSTDGTLTAEQTQYLDEGACSFCPEVTDCTSGTASEEDLLANAQGVVNAYFETLFKAFMKAMVQAGYPTNPYVFGDVLPRCPEVAPVVASDFSRQTGYLVRRVSKLTRNARSTPDAWELKQLDKFEALAAEGAERTLFEITKPDGTILPTREFEAAAIVTEGTAGTYTGRGGNSESRVYFRYMRSITMPGPPNEPPYLPCLKCHGSYDQLGAGVTEALQDLYPYDQAMGYKKGDIRGAWTIKIPMN